MLFNLVCHFFCSSACLNWVLPSQSSKSVLTGFLSRSMQYHWPGSVQTLLVSVYTIFLIQQSKLWKWWAGALLSVKCCRFAQKPRWDTIFNYYILRKFNPGREKLFHIMFSLQEGLHHYDRRRVLTQSYNFAETHLGGRILSPCLPTDHHCSCDIM